MARGYPVNRFPRDATVRQTRGVCPDCGKRGLGKVKWPVAANSAYRECQYCLQRIVYPRETA